VVKRIYGSYFTKVNFLSVSLILNANQKNQICPVRCSGTIMSNQWIITTAECCTYRQLGRKNPEIKILNNSQIQFKIKSNIINARENPVIHKKFDLETETGWNYCLVKTEAMNIAENGWQTIVYEPKIGPTPWLVPIGDYSSLELKIVSRIPSELEFFFL